MNRAEIKIYNEDCLPAMRAMRDNQFDLAIVDPPYGINRGGQIEIFTKNPKHKRKYHEQKQWDKNRPSPEYWEQLFRVSKNQIVWGGNYFTGFLSPSMGWIFWDKGQNLTMSDGELAYTTFDRALRRVVINRAEILEDKSIHPTQKPVKLYKWIIENQVEKEWSVLDTHLGSGSIAIACWDYGINLTAYEIDTDYYKQANNRLEWHKRQLQLF